MKRPLFVLPTEGMTREQMKAEARLALFGDRPEDDDSEAES